jgi:hypothetical protein
MTIHPEYIRGIRAAAEITDEYIKTRVINQAAIPDLIALRDGFSMGVSIAEMEGDSDG